MTFEGGLVRQRHALTLCRAPTLGIVLLLVALGCEGNGESTPSGAGGSGSGGDACLRACEKQADANCPQGPDRDTCVNLCSATLADAECGSAYTAFTECAANEARFTCTADGPLEMEGCWAELQPYAVCAGCRSSSSDDACDSCGKSSCCAEYKAYWGNPELEPFFECARSCIERDAASDCDCSTRYAGIADAASSMLSCRAEKCGTVCP